MRILRVELGTWSLKAVEMESRFRRVDVLDFHEIRLPLQIVDTAETYRSAISQLIARLPSHPEKIVTSLPAAQTALRFLPIPLKPRKKVEQMFRFELEDNVPFKLDDAIIEHHVERTKDGSLVFAAIAPKRHIQSYLEWLQKLGLDPDWLTFEGMGLINLYLSSIKEKKDLPEGPGLLLDIGHSKTTLSLFGEGKLEFFRSISWGGSSITHALAIAMGVSLEEAERYKMTQLRLDTPSEGASEEVRALTRAAQEAFTPFLADLSHSLVAFRNLYKQEISSVSISGGTSHTVGVEGFLENYLKTPVVQFRPYGQVNLKSDLKESSDGRFAESLGRALVFARKGTILFNFRQQEVGKGTSLTEVTSLFKNPNVIRLLQFAGVLAGIMFIHVFIAQYIAQSEAKTASDELRKAFSKTFPAVPTKQKLALTNSAPQLRKFIQQKNNELDQKLKMISKVRIPMLSLVKGISEAFPPEVRVDVNNLQIDDRAFSLDGVLYSGDLAPVTDRLKKIASLSKIELSSSGQRFTYKGEVVGR